MITAVYLSFHDLFKKLIKLTLVEAERDLNGAILEHFEFITQYYLFAYCYNCGHMRHPRYLLTLSL